MILFCKYGTDPKDPSAGFVFAWHDDGAAPDDAVYPGCLAVPYAGAIETLPVYKPDPSHRCAPPLTVEVASASKVASLVKACQKDILSGFTSKALGSSHLYGSSQTDQLNLAHDAALASGDATFKADIGCSTDGKSWAFETHTAAQVKTVADDMQTARQLARLKLAELKANVAKAASAADVAAITWA
jgi:hypothetical protein